MNMWILTLIHFTVSRFAENYFYQCTPANSQTLELTSYNHYEQLKLQNEFNCAFFVWNVPLTLLFPSPLQCALRPSEGACSTPIWKIFPETHILGVWSHFDKVWAHYPTRTFARDNWHAPARSSTWLETERRSPDAFSTGFVLARVRVATAEYLRPKGKRGEGDKRARERERGAAWTEGRQKSLKSRAVHTRNATSDVRKSTKQSNVNRIIYTDIFPHWTCFRCRRALFRLCSGKRAILAL